MTFGFVYEQRYDAKWLEMLGEEVTKYIQQLMASKAIIAASSTKKEVTSIVSKGLDSGKSQERRRANQGAGPGGSLQAVQGLQEVPRQP